MFKFLKERKKKDNKGFTLVELVIVVAILAILVGLLAPQYTKYVEKTRKSADASNMDEMVKVIKVFAADPANELATGDYTITMTNKGATSAGTSISGITDELKKEMDNSIPNWDKTVTKSQKWGDGGKPAAIQATVTVNPDGGTSVKYPETPLFAEYMASAGSATTGTNGDNADGGEQQ